MVVTVARVRVDWEEVVSYSQVFEVDDFDPDNEVEVMDKLIDAIAEQANFNVVEEVGDREITGWRVIPK